MNEHAPAVLTVVIPALNEEEAIGQTIERCVLARPEICQSELVSDVEFIVVDDGSTDRTYEIAEDRAREHSCVSVIRFEKNRGYGAAIKKGFSVGRGTYVGFLDADGTCDPAFFRQLCQALRSTSASIALGSRMGAESQMPKIRRVGNRMFAVLLGMLSGDAVTDTASGMRVIRRDVLEDLYPLSDGLDFTPAMSARALMQRVPIVEVDMPYAERLGQSKLRALQDGWRFLAVIFDAVLSYHPARILLLCFVPCLCIAVLLAVGPAELYITRGFLHDWMIYRFMVCLLLGTIGYSLLCAVALSEELLVFSSRRRSSSFIERLLHNTFSIKRLLVVASISIAGAVFLVWPGIVDFVSTGHVSVHWSRVIVSAFGVILACQSVLTCALLRIVRLARGQSGLLRAAPRKSTRPLCNSIAMGDVGAKYDEPSLRSTTSVGGDSDVVDSKSTATA